MKKFLLAFVAAIGFAFFSASAESVAYTYSDHYSADEVLTKTTAGENVVITVTYSQGTNTNSEKPKYFKSGSALRFYNNNTITFSVVDGYKITNIVFYISGDRTFGNTTVTTGKFDATNSTWSGEAQSVSITNTKGSQVRISSWIVTYTTTGGGETPTTPEGPVAKPSFNPAEGEVAKGTNVKITTATEGATIYYTIDDTEPTATSTQYTESGITIDNDMTIKAIAIKEGMTNSEVATATYTIAKETVAMPTFSVTPGTVDKGTTVEITTTTEGATIYYTTDGVTKPTASSTLYTESGITIDNDMTIKAIAIKEGMTSSEVATASYTVFGPYTDVLSYSSLVNPADNNAYSTYTVTGTSGAEYKLQCAHDGNDCLQFRSDNNNSGLVVTKSVGKVKSVTLKWKSKTTSGRIVEIYTSTTPYTDPTELYSGVSSIEQLKYDGTNLTSKHTFESTLPKYIGLRSNNKALYLTEIKIAWEPIIAPVITCTNNTVTITAEEGATIYYTTDGREPDKTSTLYEGPFPITANTTVIAIAVKGTDVSSTTQFYAKFAQTYADYAAIIAAGDGALGTVNGPITGIYKNDKYLYTVDANGKNMLLVDENAFADVTEFTNGDQFASVTGTYTAITSQIAVETLGAKTAGTTAVEPEATAIKDLVNAKKVDVANKYVKLDNVTIVADEEANCYDITDATASIRLYNRFLGELAEGSYTSVIGFVDNNYDVLRIIPIQADGHAAMEQVATPEFSVPEGSVDVSTSVQITIPEGSTGYYTTDGTKPLVGNKNTKMYTGEGITINKSTTINAIAVAEGKLHSKVATATYIVLDNNATVATFNFAEPTTLTPTVEVPAKSQGTALNNAVLTNNAATITFSDKQGQTDLRVFNSGGIFDLRLYETQYFTISVTKDKYILDKIVFTHTGNNLSNLNCGGIGLYTENGTTATWIKPNDQTDRTIDKITFTATGSVCISTITVYYKEGVATGVDNIEVEDVDAPAEYYNLQGVRVDNPGPGLYIVRRGNTVTKTLIR